MNYLRDPRILQLARRRRFRIGRRGFLGLGLAAILGASWPVQASRTAQGGRWVLREDDV